MPIAGATLFIETLTGYGQSFKAVRINASRRGKGLAARLSSNLLSGEVVWQPKTASTNLASGYDRNGKVTVNLRNLKWQKNDLQNDQPKPPQNSPPNPTPKLPALKSAKSLSPSNLPALEIAIDNLQIQDRQIGRFELVGHPEAEDWRMRRLRITNPDGTLTGDGVWQGSGQSQVNLMLDISNAGKMLERFSYPNTVKAGSGRLEANLSWTGTPDTFNYATLNGTLKLDAGKGQFLKMEPGIGKLLGILSLQSLPKRIKLDFNDVFSDGFQFDRIKGSAALKNGLLDTQDFHMDGLSAKVTMKGSVNLNDETQNLRVRVLPAIGDGVSLGVAFAAGPAVGVGALILNRVFGDPLDKLVSFEYNVTGTWADPSVAKVERGSARSRK